MTGPDPDADAVLLAAIARAERAARTAYLAALRRGIVDRRLVQRHRPVAHQGPDQCGRCREAWPCRELRERCAAYGVPVEL